MIIPYIKFGFNLWSVRERRGIKSAEVAAHLKLTRQEYSKYERGECKPPESLLLSVSRFLEIELARLKRWIAMDESRLKTTDEAPPKNAIRYMKHLEEACESVHHYYKEKTGKEINENQKNILTILKRELKKTYDLPSLPMDLILIENALDDARTENIQYLNEFPNFLLEKESLAGYIARNMYYGLFIPYAANLNFFKDNPCKNSRDAFNRLSIEEFKVLLWIAVRKKGVYQASLDIPHLQQLHDFHGLCCLMVEELKSELPPNVNADHLYQAVLLQGIGIHAIFSILQPSTFKVSNTKSSNLYDGLSDALIEAIIYEMHPVASAMIGANWDLSEEVLQAVLTHHHQPTKEVTPLCAMIKIINTYVNADFPILSKDDISEILAAYPQVVISPDVLGRGVIKLSNLKQKLYERSSSVIEQVNPKIAEYTLDKIKRTSKRPPFPFPESSVYLPPKRSDFRLDPGYQATLQNAAYATHLEFLNELLSIQKGEGLQKSTKRYEILQVRLHYTITKDIQSVAVQLKIPVEEVQSLLFGK